MAQPPAYTRLYNFTDYATANPSAPYQASYTDSEFNAIAATILAIRNNLALTQRDDGALKNGIVTPDSLSTATALLLATGTDAVVRGAWLTATAYALKDVVTNGTGTYICATAHTSGTFSTDLAAVKWVVIYDTAAFASSNSTYVQSGTGAVETTVQTKLRETTSAADYGGDPTGSADSAGDITQALAATNYVILPPGTWKNTAGFTVSSAKTLELMPGAAFTGAGAFTKAVGSSVISKSDGAAGDCWYWGRKFTGSRTVGSGPLEGYTPYTYMWDVRSDDSDVGSSFGVGVGARYYFGGSATKGGRQAFNASLWFTAATNASNLNRNYVGAQNAVHVQDDDGGTNTGAGALGAFFGSGSALYLEAAATNLYGAVGTEINTFTQNGATSARLQGLAITGCNYTRGAVVDAAISVGAQASSGGYGPHAGWKYGLLFTDDNGDFPFTNTSTVIGGQFTTPQAVQDGINFSSFTFTGQILKAVYLAINENSISLGDSGGNATIIVAGASTNGNLVLQPKGTGVVSTGTNGWAVSGTKVVGARDTGWSAMTGTANENTVYDTATVTLAQLAGRVMALQAALTTHGLIGA